MIVYEEKWYYYDILGLSFGYAFIYIDQMHEGEKDYIGKCW